MIRNRPSAFGHQPSAIQPSNISLRPTAFGHRHLPSFGACDVFTSPNDSESAFHLRPFSLRPSAPSIIQRVRCLHIPPMIRNRPSAFGHRHLPSFGAYDVFTSPNDSKSAISLRTLAFGHRHLPSFGACDVFTSPNDSESAFSLRPSAFGLQPSAISLRPSAPSIIRRVRCLHIPPMIRNRPSAFGHQPSAIQPSDISLRPSAFGHRHLPSFGACDVFTSPNDSESAFHLRPFSLRPSAFGHRHIPSFGACDVFTSPQ
ncbi:unnamed protein product [Prunus armeniaca]